ncbi:hypothetical protein B0J17DRAFT_686355 [Rhizoctonia solani]|nr:hypothetical protein B0J17DRAFT_686355 [Rhizoctonia solani]
MSFTAVLDCLHESAGQISPWVLPCRTSFLSLLIPTNALLATEHTVCAECFHSAPVISYTSTQRVCPDPDCPHPFRHSESHQWVDDAAGVEEGSTLEAAASQELIIVLDQRVSSPAPATTRGRGRGRGGRVPSGEAPPTQVSFTMAASNQVSRSPPSSQRSITSSRGSQTLRTVPDQPSPLRQSFPRVQPAFPSSQPVFPSSDPVFLSSQPTNSPFSSQRTTSTLFSIQPWIFTSHGSNASQVSATSVESNASTSTTASDRELTANMTVMIESSVRFEGAGAGGGEDQGENEEDGDEEAETPRASSEPTTPQTGSGKRRLSEDGLEWPVQKRHTSGSRDRPSSPVLKLSRRRTPQPSSSQGKNWAWVVHPITGALAE